jgi:hypothetical protein
MYSIRSAEILQEISEYLRILIIYLRIHPNNFSSLPLVSSLVPNVFLFNEKHEVKKKSYSRNRPWKPIGL